MSNLRIQIDNATSTDWLTLKQTYGDEAIERTDPTTPAGTFPPFGEPVISTIIITLSVMATTTLVAWVCKQRNLQRTTLRIKITNQNGAVTTIDLSDRRYAEGKADTALVADLVKAGLQGPAGHG